MRRSRATRHLLLAAFFMANLSVSGLFAQTPLVSEAPLPTFEVASVKQSLSGKYSAPPFSIDSDDDYTSTGGLFAANLPLTAYIAFAYKLNQQYPMLPPLPKWASVDVFEINARAAGNPTKDQLRLMVQSLLADRFKLAIHFETRELPVLALTLIKPGKTGPGLRPHEEGPACDKVAPHPANSTVTLDMLPCNIYMAINRPDHTVMAGARNTTVQVMTAFFTNVGRPGRLVIDRTGLTGKVDFSMEYVPERRGLPQPGADPQLDLPGETFLGAIRNQLGLNLEPMKAPINVPVIDHVEMPSEN